MTVKDLITVLQQCPEPDSEADGRSFHERTHGKGWSLYGFKGNAVNTGDGHLLVPSENARTLIDIHNKQVEELLASAPLSAISGMEQLIAKWREESDAVFRRALHASTYQHRLAKCRMQCADDLTSLVAHLKGTK